MSSEVVATLLHLSYGTKHFCLLLKRSLTLGMVGPVVHIRVFQPSDQEAVERLFCHEANELTKRTARAIFFGWSSMSLFCAGVVGMLSIGTAHNQGRESSNKYNIVSATIGGIILWGTSVYLTCHWLTRKKVKQYMKHSPNEDLQNIAEYYKLKAVTDSKYEPEGKSNFWVCSPDQEPSNIVGAIGFDYNPVTDEGELSRLGISSGHKYAINELVHTLVNWAKQKGVRVIVAGSKRTRSPEFVDGKNTFDDFDSIRHLIYLDLLSQYKKS
ncbi:hypothetical protein Unana1_04186 [Umbelopsis nana]